MGQLTDFFETRLWDFGRAKGLCIGSCTAVFVPKTLSSQCHSRVLWAGSCCSRDLCKADVLRPCDNSQHVTSQLIASSGAMVGNTAFFFFFLLTAAPSLPVTSPWPSPSLQPSSSSLSSAACSRQASETQVSCPEPPQVRLQTWKSGSVRLLFPLLCLVQCMPLCACLHACAHAFQAQRVSFRSLLLTSCPGRRRG